ncbi:MAG: hypothetical protein AAGE52_26230, partial [Myxococcota bacterium]
AALAAFIALPAFAQAPDPSAIFPRQALVDPEPSGLTRLPLPTEILSACESDLSDLRLLRHGREIPYFVDAEARPWQGDLVRQPLVPLHVEQRQEPREGAPTRHIEVFRVSMPPHPPPEGQEWDLVFASPQGRFLRQVNVRITDAEGNLGRELTTDSIFRLENARASRLRIPLPRTDASHLRIELEGDDVYLEPVLALESLTRPTEGPALTLPLEEIERRSTDEGVVIHLRRPRGFVPDAILVRTDETTFYRYAKIRDIAPGERELVGEGSFVRVADLPAATRNAIDVGTTHGDVLEIALHGDDAPLPADLRFEARVRQPALVFDNRPGTRIVFGGGRARAPTYGIARVLGGQPHLSFPAVGLGELQDNDLFDTAPALAFAMHPGRVVDPRRFASSQELLIPATREGLVRVIPTLDTLAASTLGLNDLRIVDADRQQWAFFRGQSERGEVPLEVGSPEAVEESEWGIALPATRYPIALPAPLLLPREISIRADTSYIDREAVFVGRYRDGEEMYVVGTGRLQRRPGDDTTNPIVVSEEVEALELWVADGNDAPLRNVEAIAAVEIPTLYVAAPEGRYEILVGDPTADPPTYELHRAEDLILSVEAEATGNLGDLVENAAHEPPSAFTKSWQDVLLWVVLIAGVLLLLLVTIRSAGREEEGPVDEPAEEAA